MERWNILNTSNILGRSTTEGETLEPISILVETPQGTPDLAEIPSVPEEKFINLSQAFGSS